MNTHPLYFDFNATTPLDPRCLESMLPYLTHDFGNSANQSHSMGWSSQNAINLATTQVASLLGCKNHEIIWNSGATEGNNSVLHYFAQRTGPDEARPHFIVSAIEHPSVLATATELLQQKKIELTLLEVDPQGFVSSEKLEAAIQPNTKLASIMWVNNEVGTIQDIEKLSQICFQRNVHFHTDATQAIGKLPIHLDQIPISYLTASAHKFYGPKGVGILYSRSKSPYAPVPKILSGGSHQRGMRPGTMNTPGIVGTGKACEILQSEMREENVKIKKLTQGFWNQLISEFPNASLNGPPISGETRSCMNLNFTLPNKSVDLVIGKLTQLAFSQGSACHSGETSMSPTLKAIGLTEQQAQSTLRMSVGRTTTEADIRKAIEILKRAFAS